MRFLVLALFSGLAWGQMASSIEPVNSASQAMQSASTPEEPVADANSLLPNLPALPTNKATLIGGTISNLDRVRDQIVLRAFGGRSIKVLYDGRTHIWTDGTQATTRDLNIGQKAYIDTILDGDTIFAKNIRVLSHGTAGESQGQIISFDRTRDQLTLNDALSSKSFVVRIMPGTKVMNNDQEVSINALQPGSLVALQFHPEGNGIAAQQITILAAPGTNFTFVGKVIFLDLHRGIVALMDPRDKKNYEVHFDPNTVHITGDLHVDSDVTVQASFDGTQYATNGITVSPSSN